MGVNYYLYFNIQNAFMECFEIEQRNEEIIVQTLEACLDPVDLLALLKEVHMLYEKASLNQVARYGLLRKSVGKHIDPAQFAFYRGAKSCHELRKIVTYSVPRTELFGRGLQIPHFRNGKTFNEDGQARLAAYRSQRGTKVNNGSAGLARRPAWKIGS